jgi:hypothetical protein
VPARSFWKQASRSLPSKFSHLLKPPTVVSLRAGGVDGVALGVAAVLGAVDGAAGVAPGVAVVLGAVDGAVPGVADGAVLGAVGGIVLGAGAGAVFGVSEGAGAGGYVVCAKAAPAIASAAVTLTSLRIM